MQWLKKIAGALIFAWAAAQEAMPIKFLDWIGRFSVARDVSQFLRKWAIMPATPLSTFISIGLLAVGICLLLPSSIWRLAKTELFTLVSTARSNAAKRSQPVKVDTVSRTSVPLANGGPNTSPPGPHLETPTEPLPSVTVSPPLPPNATFAFNGRVFFGIKHHYTRDENIEFRAALRDVYDCIAHNYAPITATYDGPIVHFTRNFVSMIRDNGAHRTNEIL
jgi:hypothetical protein